MPLTPDIAEQVLAACRQNASEIAAVISRAFALPLEISPDKIETFNYTGPPPEWSGPGLAFVFKVGDEAAVLLLAASSGLVPDWTQSPVPADQIKLTALAEELGKALLPATHLPDDFLIGYVDNLAAAVTRGQVADDAGAIHFVVKSGDTTAALRMIWPATGADAILLAPPTVAAPIQESIPLPPPFSPAPVVKTAAQVEQELADHLDSLPSYIRSLLRISVPVSVHLATVRQPVSRVLNIGPGSIIQFEKNCERPLTLCIGNQPVAEGDAVKVGEKFGIKLTSMVLPGEKFIALRGTRK